MAFGSPGAPAGRWRSTGGDLRIYGELDVLPLASLRVVRGDHLDGNAPLSSLRGIGTPPEWVQRFAMQALQSVDEIIVTGNRTAGTGSAPKSRAGGG